MLSNNEVYANNQYHSYEPGGMLGVNELLSRLQVYRIIHFKIRTIICAVM